MKWVGLNEKNYWKRIQAIRERDLELTISEQTPESHAFIFKRTQEKIQNLEFLTMQIIQSMGEQTKDKLTAMDFLRRLYIDELSMFWHGAFNFLERDANGQIHPIKYNNNNNNNANANFLNLPYAGKSKVIEDERDRDYDPVF